MTITPNDINNKEFKKVLRGYDEDEVDEFLEEIVDDYEKNYRENITLKEKISSLEEKLKHYEDIELTLQNTLILAQSAAEQAKDSSKKDSELILKQAQDDASKMIYEAKETVLKIKKKKCLNMSMNCLNPGLLDFYRQKLILSINAIWMRKNRILT